MNAERRANRGAGAPPAGSGGVSPPVGATRTGTVALLPLAARAGLGLINGWDGNTVQRLENLNKPVKMRIVVLLTVVLLAILIPGCGKPPPPKPPTLKDQATAIGLNLISNSLVSPTTAKFSAVSCVERTDRTFLISGQVDSQNAFGAMLRKEFNCVLTNLGNDRLDWLGISVGGDATINRNLIPQDGKLLDSKIVVFADEMSLERKKYKRVDGTIKNVSNHALTSASISYNLFDASGHFSGTSQAFFIGDPIKSNGVWQFSTDPFSFDLTPKFGDMTSSP